MSSLARSAFGLAVLAISLSVSGGASASVATTQNVPPGPGSPGVVVLCAPTPSYACTDDGYSSWLVNPSGWAWADYGGTWPSYNSYGPHNCTLYVAYRLQEEGINLGWSAFADSWATEAAAPGGGGTVDQTPSVGSVAQWNYSPNQGHVAFVEQVTSTYIVVTADNYESSSASYMPGGWTDSYEIDLNSPAMPDNFIHFASQTTTTTSPPPSISIGSWNRAAEPAGSAALNGGGNGQLVSVSCPSLGDCAAGGFVWKTKQGGVGALVVDEVNGSWQNAFLVPGSSTLAQGSEAAVNTISCSSVGNCAAGGLYSYGDVRGQAFVANEVNGTWGDAIEVPGSAALNTSTYAMVNVVSCSSPGNCAAGGFFSFSLYGTQAFVVNEVDGVWGNASSLYASSINTLSCASSGNCSAGGDIETGKEEPDGTPQMEPTVANEINGNWGPAVELPGSTALNSGGYGEVNSISCASAGNCSLVGQYENAHRITSVYDGQFESFVASEVNGTWSNAEEAPNSAVLNTSGAANLNSISCISAGNCSAGGYYQATAKHREAFVINEISGKWHDALEVPHISVLNRYGDAMVNSLSCASAGRCSAGGYYYSTSGTREAFIVNESSGKWDNAEEVPGISTLNLNWAEVDAVACNSGGYCSAVGKYDTRSHGYQVFTANN